MGAYSLENQLIANQVGRPLLRGIAIAKQPLQIGVYMQDPMILNFYSQTRGAGRPNQTKTWPSTGQ